MTATWLRLSGSLLVLATAAALAGCGGNSAASVDGAKQGRAPKSIEAAITEARARAYAEAVNLHGADLPSLRRVAEITGDREREFGQRFARCAGGVDPDHRVLDLGSLRFVGAGAGTSKTFASDVEIKPAAALATLDNRAIRSRRAQACLSRLLPSALESWNSPEIGAIRVSRLATPLAGIGRSFGYRVGITLSTPRKEPIPLYIDLLGFTSGPAEISLSATGSPRPPRTDVEQRLMSRLNGRAQALRDWLGQGSPSTGTGRPPVPGCHRHGGVPASLWQAAYPRRRKA